MKKILLMAAVAGATLFASCNKESYYHTVELIYPTAYQTGIVYADQTLDSVLFATTDNFAVTASEAWMSIPTERATGKIDNNYRYVWEVSVPLHFQPNDTGAPRQGIVSVHASGSDDWSQTIRATYYQLSWLNITQPAPSIEEKSEGATTKVSFTAKGITATTATYTLKFTAYGSWTLTDGTFVHPQTEQMAGVEGAQEVLLTIEPNESTAKRTDTLTLISNGISNEITFEQSAKEE